MLQPVSATTTTMLDYPSSAPQPVVRPPFSPANDIADIGMSSEKLLSGGRREAMSLSGQLQLAQGASVFAETIGQLLKMPRGENESLAAYAVRITEAVKALSPGEKLALQRLLNQVVNGLTLRLLGEVLKNPSGPGAARLALHMEMTQLSDHDLPAEAAVTSYRQTAGMQPVPAGRETAPLAKLVPANPGIGNPPPLDLAGAEAEAQAAASSVAGSSRTEQDGRTAAIPTASSTGPGSVNGQAAGPAPATALASTGADPNAAPGAEATPSSGKQPPSLSGADPLKAGTATTVESAAAGERSKAGHAASLPSAVHPDAAVTRAESEPGSIAAFRPGTGSETGMAAGDDAAAPPPQPSRSTTGQAAGPFAVPDVQAEVTSSDGVYPMEAGSRLTADGKSAAAGLRTSPMEASRASILAEADAGPPTELDLAPDADAVYRPARPVTAESILGITQGLIKAFSGHALAEALTPLLSLSPLPEALDPALDDTQAMPKQDLPLGRSSQDLEGSASNMPTSQQQPDEAATAKRQATATPHAGQPAAEAADMHEQLQLALPVILPRDGMPLPYLTYPPTEQEPKREERKVREIAEVDEDGDGQQHPSGDHRSNDRDKDGETEEAPTNAAAVNAETESGHGGEDGRANDLYWRMAGWS
ncbi:hypothetical protein E2F50_15345 [Rhizobium deserti]|uniref:Uncharacterized protein n=1 Tax=Rhizobium deserti TaxID=2547961 RepID=A0A4V3APF0_9HYPH|nr:hypothetical protein [Rhizobium deserti]TDK35598.1 hypothetical protein E2F50_15345 [Rhizobium deserti]